MNSIHAHASTLLSNSHFLLPRLGPEDPFLPPAAIASIESVQAELEPLEDKLVKDDSRGSKARWAAHKRGRLSGKGEGGRKEIWRNVERSFEAESLVALGTSCVIRRWGRQLTSLSQVCFSSSWPTTR